MENDQKNYSGLGETGGRKLIKMAYPPKQQTRTSLQQLKKLRKLCLDLPQAHEAEAWGEPTFRIKNKMFTMFANPDTHRGAGKTGVWIKSKPEDRDLLIKESPEKYFVPPYMGPSGWIGAFLDERTDWEELKSLLREGYRKVARRKSNILTNDY
ncbi:MAG: MmcQ/YjbR family DNA-binding protein [Anaerolineales bacterium]